MSDHWDIFPVNPSYYQYFLNYTCIEAGRTQTRSASNQGKQCNPTHSEFHHKVAPNILFVLRSKAGYSICFVRMYKTLYCLCFVPGFRSNCNITPFSSQMSCIWTLIVAPIYNEYQNCQHMSYYYPLYLFTL